VRGSMVNIQCATAEIRRGKKEERRRKKKPHGKNIGLMSASATHGGHIYSDHRRRIWTIQLYLPGCDSVHPNICFLGPTRVHIRNGISTGSATFAQPIAECPYRPTLQWAAPSPQNFPFVWGIGTPSNNTRFLRPRQVHNPNAISIG